MNPDLIETLRAAQRFGFFGSRPIEEAAEHAQAYVVAIGSLPAGARLVDLGSGGGLPGLVLADAYAQAEVVLIDRREKRTDFLRRAVRRLDFEHVRVQTADVATLVDEVRSGETPPFDVVTARGFGPPEVTVRFARSLIEDLGQIVISEPPTGDRWDEALLRELGLVRATHGPVSIFRPGVSRETPGT